MSRRGKSVESLEKEITLLKDKLKAAKRRERTNRIKLRNEYFIEFTKYILNKVNVSPNYWEEVDLKKLADNLTSSETSVPLKNDKEVKEIIKEMINARPKTTCRKKKSN